MYIFDQVIPAQQIVFFFILHIDETELISYQEFLVIVYTKTLVVSE